MEKQIIKLVKNNPNDQELGKAMRKWYHEGLGCPFYKDLNTCEIFENTNNDDYCPCSHCMDKKLYLETNDK